MTRWQSSPEYLSLPDHQRTLLCEWIGSTRSAPQIEVKTRIPAAVIRRLRDIRRRELANLKREINGAEQQECPPDFLAALRAAGHPYGAGEIRMVPRIP